MTWQSIASIALDYFTPLTGISLLTNFMSVWDSEVSMTVQLVYRSDEIRQND